MFRDELAPLLRCPLCGDQFDFEEKETPDTGRAEFGLLRCSCSTFPVIDGVPIIQSEPVQFREHTRGATKSDGVQIGTLNSLLARDETSRALEECLCVPKLPHFIQSLLGWRISNSSPIKRLERARGRSDFTRQILQQRDTISAREILEFYFLQNDAISPDVGHYFIYGFTQPRHLASLSLCSTIPSTPKPVLDVGCGIGYLDHYLCSRVDPSPVVGMDMNFFQLWIAKHWVTPKSNFVCANAGQRLPFADNSFSATVCADAYHYIPNRRDLLIDISRCAPDRPLVLARVGNVSVMPNEGTESSLAEYLEEFGCTPAIFDENELLSAYLRRQDALAQFERSAKSWSESKWLSFVLNPEAATRRASENDRQLPHCVGKPAINPIYQQRKRIGDEVRLNFEFPSIWYAYENNRMLSYIPRQVTISASDLDSVQSGESPSGLSRLIEDYALIGIPERF